MQVAQTKPASRTPSSRAAVLPLAIGCDQLGSCLLGQYIAQKHGSAAQCFPALSSPVDPCTLGPLHVSKAALACKDTIDSQAPCKIPPSFFSPSLAIQQESGKATPAFNTDRLKTGDCR